MKGNTRTGTRRGPAPSARRRAAWLALAGVAVAALAAAASLARWPSEDADATARVSGVAGLERGNPPAAQHAPTDRPQSPRPTRAQFVADPSPAAPLQNPLDALRAYRYLEQICAIGPRPSGSPGMLRQQELLRRHFEEFGGQVSLQKFQARNPLGGPDVPMANLIVQWHPERQERILICTHYDTRPLPDRDPDPDRRQSGVFIGANDGGSGVAVMMELAHLMPDLDSRYGVDFVMFDGEELVYKEHRDPYYLGSTWFARQYAKHPPEYKYRWGVLLDMVGDANLQIYEEVQSAAWRDTRPLVRAIWATAARLGVDEFIPRPRYSVGDDHLPLRNIAKIPTCDVIDFDYPAWHTEADTLRRCSGSSLAKVGWVVYEWLKSQ
jgi:glutaminyl-peptide cyclotransferase